MYSTLLHKTMFYLVGNSGVTREKEGYKDETQGLYYQRNLPSKVGDRHVYKENVQ